MIILWIVLSIVIGVAATARGRNGIGWFFISIFLSPIIAVLLLLVFPNLKQEALLRSIAEGRGYDGGRVLVTPEPPLREDFRPAERTSRSGIGAFIGSMVIVIAIAATLFMVANTPDGPIDSSSPPLSKANLERASFIPTVENERQWSPHIVPAQWPGFSVVSDGKPLSHKTDHDKLMLAKRVINRWTDYTVHKIKKRPTASESDIAIKYLLTIDPSSPVFADAWGTFIQLRRVDREIANSAY